MGNWLATYSPRSIGKAISKRKIEEVVDDSDDDISTEDSILNASKRQKLMTTSQYIYKTLFEEGKDSDITVVALEHQWHLHKVYLCQSPYFGSMFSGNWKEANDTVISIEILDETITVDSLTIVLGSLYKDDVVMESTHIISVLASAVLLQMDPLIDMCSQIMKETINVKTVLNYHDACCRYGILGVEKDCKKWLLQNLVTRVNECPQVLRQVSKGLMKELVSSHDLYVIQTEFSLYMVLKVWAFLKMNEDWRGNEESAHTGAHKFFGERKAAGYFLEEEGKAFAETFSGLRFVHVLCHYFDIETINSDRILPPSWIQPAAMRQWYNMVRVEKDKDRGPVDVPESVFYEHCNRCGRVLPVNKQHIWRWTGFNFGVDVVMTYDDFCIKLKRNHRPEILNHVNSSNKRMIMYRIEVSSLNDQKQATYYKSTGIKSACLTRNQELRVLEVDRETATFPMILSACFLLVTPANLHLTQPPNV